MLVYLILVAVILIAAAAGALLLTRRKSAAGAEDLDVPDITILQKVKHLDYQPGMKPILPVSPKSIPHPVQKPGVLPRPGTTSVTDGMADITSSFRTLTGKYSLDQFTLATADGLVFASSGGEDAHADAARFGEMFVNDPLVETPGVILFGLDHKGSGLVGIIRTDLRIPEEVEKMIESDTKDILNWWI
jgi:hypothetical protein